MQSQRHKEEKLQNRMTQPDVRLLVAQHPVQHIRFHTQRNKDSGTQQTVHKGRGDPVALPPLRSLRRPANRGRDLRAQTGPGKKGITPQQHRAQQPDPEIPGERRNGENRSGRCSGRQGSICRQRRRKGFRLGLHRRRAPAQQAERSGQHPCGQHHPHQYRQPQQHRKPARQFQPLPQPAQGKHYQGGHPCRETHGKNRLKPFTHGLPHFHRSDGAAHPLPRRSAAGYSEKPPQRRAKNPQSCALPPVRSHSGAPRSGPPAP